MVKDHNRGVVKIWGQEGFTPMAEMCRRKRDGRPVDPLPYLLRDHCRTAWPGGQECHRRIEYVVRGSSTPQARA